MTEDTRPDPDALLRRVQADARRERRGTLKIFFGFAPGVGKTFAMLESAKRLTAEGVHVVIGCVETHGRQDTAALLDGIPVLPMRKVPYRGREIDELDLDAALSLRPGVLLVDELAHSNVPGVRHAKRWQDVMELLDAGINVHTTLNVQHVESLNDIVAQVTSVRVRETVPDAVLDRADEVELIDLPPGDLLERLREGKVYLSDAASRAATHFFQRGNLLALRELALRQTAARVDADVQAYREEHGIRRTWAAAERILVCVGPSPASARLVRAARRIAVGLRAPWVAAYVEVTSAAMRASDRERLESHLRLAESLGGTVVRLTGLRASEAILEHARKHDVTRLILGKPTHSRLRDLIRGSLLDEVVRGSGAIDVLVISGDEPEPAADRSLEPRIAPARDWTGISAAAGLVVTATSLGLLGRSVLAAPDLVMLYLLVIMVVAATSSRAASVVAAALSVAAYDFCFVPPYYTFAVDDLKHVLSFGMMFAVGLVISALTARVRRQEQDARTRELRTAALYSLSREIGSALDETQVAHALAVQGKDVFSSDIAVLLPGEGERMNVAAVDGDLQLDSTELGVARWAQQHRRLAGRGTDTLPGSRVLCAPLTSGAKVLGVMALAPRGGRTLLHDERAMLEAFVRQGALALERVRLAEETKAAVLKARTEEMRSSLLSAVSHDLRTPLASITGAASALRDPTADLDAEQRVDLLVTIHEEAERLERLVANLLDMTKLESGALVVKRDWVPVEEIVGGALTRLEKQLAGRGVSTDLPGDLPLLSVDPVLLEQVLVNLLENAARHTPGEGSIDVSARAIDTEALEIDVADRGPGVPVGDEERIFEKFYRGPGAPPGGVGLGLAICRGIAEAHGGTLVALQRPGGGAVLRLRLPLLGVAPTVPEEPAEVDAVSTIESGR